MSIYVKLRRDTTQVSTTQETLRFCIMDPSKNRNAEPDKTSDCDGHET
jgi:hypothetical protein